MALDKIPWHVLIKEGLRLVDTARQAKAERSEERPRPAASGQEQGSVEALRQRLEAVEAQNRRDAEVAEQMAQQVRRLSEAADELRARTRLALWLAGGGLALAAAALVVLLATL